MLTRILLLNMLLILSSCGKDETVTPVGHSPDDQRTYIIVGTDQEEFFGNEGPIAQPSPGDDFYGQDAQHAIHPPSYKDNGDGTVTDEVTGLMWTNDPGDKLTTTEAEQRLTTLSVGGYSDWRIPTIKELYSLILFSGVDPSGWTGGDISLLKPFIDTVFFRFRYGDEQQGERIIDAQYLSSTEYVSTTMNAQQTRFGVNFADGRIKGYPQSNPQGGDFKWFVLYVRGNPDYGKNNFVDHGDGTISDLATGLMWSAEDSGEGMNWEDALKWAQEQNAANHLGYSDWRLPSVKELQSIVDYSRSPATTQSPAIDPLFQCTQITDEGGAADFPFYWSGTTHVNWVDGSFAAYVAFGTGFGFMEAPPGSGNYILMDVHGAGCQRSDPKDGDPSMFPNGHGPQGDVVRINNYVRLVRSLDNT